MIVQNPSFGLEKCADLVELAPYRDRHRDELDLALFSTLCYQDSIFCVRSESLNQGKRATKSRIVDFEVTKETRTKPRCTVEEKENTSAFLLKDYLLRRAALRPTVQESL